MTTPASERLALQIKLIFNPESGAKDESPSQLLEIVQHLQNRHFAPEVLLIEEDSDLKRAIDEAIERGIELFLVYGGDGTIASAAANLAGRQVSLGILPGGTQNNIALSLGIPDDLTEAIEIFTRGHKLKIDVGLAQCNGQEHIFIETCSIGLFSALYPAADEIQRGNLAPLGDFLSTLVTAPASAMHLVLDDEQEIETQGHIILAANMPFAGPHFQLAPEKSYLDGLLDLLVFAELSKLELFSKVIQLADSEQNDPRLQRYRVSACEIRTDPEMPILADGFQIGEGEVKISIWPKALTVIN